MTHAFLWLIALPLLSAPLDYLAGRLTYPEGKTRNTINPVRWVAVIAMLATWIPFYLAAQSLQANGVTTYTYGAITLRLDGLSLVLAGAALFLSTLVVIFSGPYLAGEEGEEKYYALVTAMTGAIIGLGSANDLFNLWVWFEAMAIASYMLVAFYRDQPNSLEAGFKYLTQSAVGSVLILLGIALVFAETGTLNLAQIQASAVNSPLLLSAGALFLIGFGVKAALVPLHTWLPDAHSQAPSGISALLSGVVIEAGLVAMLKALGPMGGITNLWGPLLLGFAAVNMLAGNLMALRQTQIKRLLAYSSLSHMGYMLLGLGIAITFKQAGAAEGALFHLFNHAVMKGLAFLAAGALLYALHLQRGNHGPLTIQDLTGAARRYPVAALTFSIAVLGLGGLPPLSGFMSKWQIFTAGFVVQNPVLMALVIFAALNSVLSLAYYAPLVNALYRQDRSPAVTYGSSMPVLMELPLILLAFVVVILGIWPTLLSWLAGPGASALLVLFSG